MGSVAVAAEEEERGFDAGETIFVAVGKCVEQSERALLWAVHNFYGKSLCVLHVHWPSRLVAMRYPVEGNTPADKLRQYTQRAYRELEQEKLRKLLDHYRLILSEKGVQAYEVWIEMDEVEKGIVEIIARHDVRWLVMGAAADECYNERLSGLKSRKAVFVCQEAASSCHIWFICKGHLIYTRRDSQGSLETESMPPLLLTNLPTEIKQIELLNSHSVDRLSNLDIEEDANELEEISSGLSSYCSINPNLSSNRVVDSRKLTSLLADEDQQVQKQAVIQSCLSEQSTEDARVSKWIEFGDTANQWTGEEDVVEAKCKAKAFQSLYVKEISHGKDIEDAIERGKEELERMKDKRDEFTKELRVVQEENSALESQLTKLQEEIRELEERTLSAVTLLISFREQRDRLRKEQLHAVREVEWIKRLMKHEPSSFCRSEFPVFSFLEINEATNDFDPSWKIAEGRYGTVYRGILRQVRVAIKMLPSYGSKRQSAFQREVEIISRTRHPNLVSLVGMCPESRSLVHEYLKKGSLEDCLSRKDNTLTWKVRMCIATEICSVLIFLHSNKPSIVHGNLKSSNILLDANNVSKLGDLGMISLIPQNELTGSAAISSVYTDPEYLVTGELTKESDVYSFGVVLLTLLTARPLPGLVKDVKCALENGNINAVLDSSVGDWPLDQAKLLVQLALKCCSPTRLDRPDLVSDVLAVLEPMKKASYTATASCSVPKKLKRTPSHFVCPILQEIMEDPQIAADGFTYESEAIRGWLDTGHNTSPMTNLKLAHCKLVPNYALQNAILEWQLQQ